MAVGIIQSDYYTGLTHHVSPSLFFSLTLLPTPFSGINEFLSLYHCSNRLVNVFITALGKEIIKLSLLTDDQYLKRRPPKSSCLSVSALRVMWSFLIFLFNKVKRHQQGETADIRLEKEERENPSEGNRQRRTSPYRHSFNTGGNETLCMYDNNNNNKKRLWLSTETKS